MLRNLCDFLQTLPLLQNIFKGEMQRDPAWGSFLVRARRLNIVPIVEELVVHPRRKAGQSERPSQSLVILNKEILMGMMSVSLAAAAHKLGISKTTLKNASRSLGLQRWPFRTAKKDTHHTECEENVFDLYSGDNFQIEQQDHLSHEKVFPHPYSSVLSVRPAEPMQANLADLSIAWIPTSCMAWPESEEERVRVRHDCARICPLFYNGGEAWEEEDI